jgi:hypothetical protein
MGLRCDASYKNIKDMPLTNYRKEFIKSSIDIPIWAIENNEEFDKLNGVLITLTNFCDKIVFSIPAGKRSLGETPLECCLRELSEEVGFVQITKKISENDEVDSIINNLKSININENKKTQNINKIQLIEVDWLEQPDCMFRATAETHTAVYFIK